MIIKDRFGSYQKKSSLKLILRWILPVLMIGILIYAYKTFNNSDTSIERLEGTVIFACGAEKKDGDSFICGDSKMGNSHTQSSKKSRSGKFSSLINRKSKYGFSYSCDTVTAGAYYRITVWRHTDSPKESYIAVSSTNDSEFYIQTNKGAEKDKDGWEKLELLFQAPEDNSLQSFKIYTYIHGDLSSAYFDDLSLETVDKKEVEKTIDNSSLTKIALYLDDKALSKIKQKRKEALDVGLLRTAEDDWVKSKILIEGEKELTVDLRLKGDWTDHLKGDDWSYRINTKSDESWNRLQSFSLQHPGTRYYLHEWVFHKLLEEVDVLTPRYDLIELTINGSKEKLYAYEEHFAKQLVEYKNRREGVIIKFAEDIIWDQRYRDNMHQISSSVKSPNMSRLSEVEVFKENKTFKNPVLKDQFEQAKNLLFTYQYGLEPVDQVFDIEKLAKYYAIVEIMQAYHSVVWHNQRFYYNPFVKKLEPIGYDGFTEDGVFKFHNRVFFGAYQSKEDSNINAVYYNSLFKNPEFAKHYAHALQTYTSKEFLNSFFAKNEKELNARLALVNKYIPSYNFDPETIYKTARTIANTIEPLNSNTVKAYRSECSTDSCGIQLVNKHLLPISIIGSGLGDQEMSNSLTEIISNSNSPNFKPSFTEITIPENHKFIFYKVAGLEKIYAVTIGKWSISRVPSKVDKSLQVPLVIDKDFSVKNNIVHIFPGTHTISKPMIIPKDHTFLLTENTTLDLVNNAYIISYGDVQFKGLENKPVNFTSSTKANQGIFVSQSSKRSSLEWVRFSDLNTLTSGTWRLTGAVNFYESDVTMKNVTIENNQCEDALNTVRSNFDITNLNISNTFADGFDADFCVGVLRSSTLINTGNDAVDFSGSKIDIYDLTLRDIADKGISAGEESTLKINSANIDKADIGVASKDLSKVTIKDIDLKNCNKGFAAYRKKPEYGGGIIDIANYTEENVKILELADRESRIKFLNKK